VDFRFGVEVTRLELTDGRVRATLEQAPDRTGLRHILVPGFAPAVPPDPASFDAFVCALPWERLYAISRHDEGLLRHPAWQRMAALRNVHPLTIRLWFENPIEGAEQHYILSSGTLFDVLRPTPEPDRYEGIRLIDTLVENVDTHLSGFRYERETYLDGAQADAIVERVLTDLERVYPGQIRSNRVARRFLHTREGIIACRPGVWSKRAPQQLGISGCVLAGDWTRQPYGVCMEGAVRSGQLAAQALLSGKQHEETPAAFAQLTHSLKTIFARS
jgi:hypothetical protein